MNSTNAPHTVVLSQSQDLHGYVEAFEVAWTQGVVRDLTPFLPKADDPLYLPVLRELIRVDLEYRWRHGQPLAITDYGRKFPELWSDPLLRAEIAFEEYRLRRQAGQNPTPAEYARAYGIDTSDWPADSSSVPVPQAVSQAAVGRRDSSWVEVARRYQELWAQRRDTKSLNLDSWCDLFGPGNEQADLLRDLHQSSPELALAFTRSVIAMPEVGADLLGFHLIAELGQGGFGKVFLAEQRQLANRLVVLKVATQLKREPQTLAQLQHTNIVPILSVHQTPPHQAICMPYLGSTTLADLFDDISHEQHVPHSGQMVLSTLHDRRQRTESMVTSRYAIDASGLPSTPEAFDNSPSNARPLSGRHIPVLEPPPAVVETFQHMTYVEAVLTIAAQLADGLAHAHARGILHRDLKPANVLLTDEAQPMILDFNLAEDTKLRDTLSGASVGGTLPYMAPEQFELMQGKDVSCDTRTDLYSLGVILFELLTGRVLFQSHHGRQRHEAFREMYRDRLGGPPPLRRFNRDVSPAIEAIVQRCLEPNPQRRYQSAEQLREDLRRQLHHQPLKYAPEPSWRERVAKFRRRHPRLTSATSVAAVAAVFIGVLTTLLILRGQNLARWEARDTFAHFQGDLQAVQFYLNARSAPEHIDQGLKLSQAALNTYGVLDDPGWREASAVVNLSPPERQRLEAEVGHLLLLRARALTLQGDQAPDSAKQRESFQEALHLCALAQDCYSADEIPQALWEQEAQLHERLGQTEEAAQRRHLAAQVPPRTARDYYLAAFLEAEAGEFREALTFLTTACRLDPQDFNACFLQGICYDSLGQHDRAAGCYRTCIALRPDFYGSYFNRGLTYLREQNAEQALADFNEVIRLQPGFAEAYLNRALVYIHLGQDDLAEQDLTEAIEGDNPPTRVYLIRAEVRTRLGDVEGAASDRAIGLQLTPRDEASWIARGMAHLPEDPQAALENFEQALVLNPRSLAGLQNKSHVLSKYLQQTEEAIQTLDVAIRYYPDDVRPIAGRGVLRARLGQYQAALADAEEALAKDQSPANLYQVAGIYALTSQDRPEDRDQALRLLSSALRQGFGFEYLKIDPDLNPIRAHPSFQELAEAAHAIRLTATLP